MPTFATVDEAIGAGIEAATVAVPTGFHHEVSLKLIDAGVHLLVEKPIAASVEEARDIIAHAAERRVALTVGHVERFNPAVTALHDAIGGEQIISIAISRVGPFPPRVTDVGIVTDLGVHDIDLIRWLSDSEIVERQALLTRARGGARGHRLPAVPAGERGARAHQHELADALQGAPHQRLDPDALHRLRPALRTVNEYSGFSADSQPGKLSHGSFVSRSLSVPFIEPLRAEIESFLDAAEGKAPVRVSGEDGLRSLEVALDCLANERAGAEVARG